MKLTTHTARQGATFLVIVVAVILLYYHMSNRMTPTEGTEVPTAVQEVLLKNLNKEYPATPREVMKYYMEIQKCMYNDDYTEEEFKQLALREMELYDEELCSLQEETAYLSGLQSEITQFKEDGKRMYDTWVSASTDVEYYALYGRECANMEGIYYIRTGVNLGHSGYTFVLRKDEEGHWKILGWKESGE
ncbi:MAG: hypothetical protein K6G23_05285 [Lachnospiraceae bacterium]|nr:hypothetical protein [Lachnospiraceae bacterium]